MEGSRTPGQRAGLTHAQVLTAARELLAERGMGGLTMRAVATRLGVAPNALYSHVANKTALIDELLDDALAEVGEPSADGDPGQRLHALMASTYAVLLSYPDLVPLYLTRQGARGQNAQRLGEVLLGILADSGVTGERAQEARRVLIVYTIGFAAMATQSSFEAGGPPIPAGELTGNFSTGLHWLLAGITR